MYANGNSFGTAGASIGDGSGGSTPAPGEGTRDGSLPASAAWMFAVTVWRAR
jgi:hypothetical protein